MIIPGLFINCYLIPQTIHIFEQKIYLENVHYLKLGEIRINWIENFFMKNIKSIFQLYISI